MTIEWIEIEKLKPNPKNPNKHSPEQIERLVKIIKYQNWRHPIIVSNRTGLIVAGHGRLEAAKQIGLQKVPVHYQDFEDADQEYAFLVSDNSIASWAELDLGSINAELENFNPDFDIDLLGIKDFILEPADRDQGDPDETPEVKEGPSICQPGDLWILGEHRLLCGDSTKREDVERLMSGEKADMVFTDPPYNVASESTNFTASFSKGMGTLAKAEWDKNCDIESLITNLFETTKKEFTAYIWTSHYLIQRIWDFCKGRGFDFVGYLVWNKTNPLPSMSKRHPAWNTELCVYIAEGGPGRIYNHKDGENFLSCRSHSRVSDGSHPTMKPIELITPLLEASSNQNSIVSDLFLGSGSTLIACEKTNRKCFGMEIDPHYCDVILARFAKFSGKDPVRQDGTKWSEQFSN